MSTVVNAPPTVLTLADVSFRSVTVNVIQPNLSSPAAVDVDLYLPSYVSESERVANDSCCFVSESIITHGSPGAVTVNFKASFAWTSACKQRNCIICLARDSLFFVKGTINHAPAVMYTFGDAFFPFHCIELMSTKSVHNYIHSYC